MRSGSLGNRGVINEISMKGKEIDTSFIFNRKKKDLA